MSTTMQLVTVPGGASAPRRRDLRALRRETETDITPPRRSPFFFPAIDGLRGLAILSVLLYHSNWSPRGLFGVDVFFVVSGFLITLLLIRELDRTNRVAFVSFFKRRAKRLIPGVLITLGLTLIVVWQFGSSGELQNAAVKVQFALLQVANWQQLGSGEQYWDHSGQIQPLAHMWSLSLTEQFYVVWPFVLLALWRLCRRSSKAVAITVAVLTVAAAAVSPLLFDGTNSDRLYLGTDSHAVGFVAGAAAAAFVFWARSRRAVRRQTHVPVLRRQRILITAMSAVSLSIVLTASVATTSYHESWLYQGGFALVAIAAATFTATLASDANLLTRFFAFSLFTAFGKVSYAVFLLHLPVFWMIQTVQPDVPALALFGLGTGVTWLVAAVLHYGVTERMRLARWRWKTGIPALITGIAVVVGMSIGLPHIRVTQSQATAFSDSTPASLKLEPGAAGGRPVVLTLGDSLANDFAEILTDHGTDAFAVHDGGAGGCGIMPAMQVRATSGYTWKDLTRCQGWEARWKQEIANTRPDFIIVHSSWDAAANFVDGAWIKPGDHAFDTQYAERLNEVSKWAAEIVPHATILVSDDRDHNGIISSGDQLQAYNELLKRVVDATPNMTLLPFGEALCARGACNDGQDQRTLFLQDDVHLAPAGMRTLAPWLEQRLAAAQSDNH